MRSCDSARRAVHFHRRSNNASARRARENPLHFPDENSPLLRELRCGSRVLCSLTRRHLLSPYVSTCEMSSLFLFSAGRHERERKRPSFFSSNAHSSPFAVVVCALRALDPLIRGGSWPGSARDAGSPQPGRHRRPLTR